MKVTARTWHSNVQHSSTGTEVYWNHQAPRTGYKTKPTLFGASRSRCGADVFTPTATGAVYCCFLEVGYYRTTVSTTWYILPLHGLYMGALPSICRLTYFTCQLLCTLTSYRVQSRTSSEAKRRTSKLQLAVEIFIMLIRK